MPHWPRQQAHALILRVTKADRRYAGFDLSLLGSDLKPDRIVTATDLKRDRLEFPIFYGEDVLLPEGQTPAYLGQAVAILIYQDFARFRFAKEKVQFNDAVVRYGEVTGPLQRDPWGSSRFVRVGGKTAHDEDVFSAMKQGPISPSYDNHEPVWPKPARDGDVGAQGMYHANRIDDELAHPPADWLILTRDYATQSGDTAALEPDCANAWYDAEKQELHLVVPTQSPQEVAEGAATMLGKSRIGLKRLFLHPCFTVGYGSKDHCIYAVLWSCGLAVRRRPAGAARQRSFRTVSDRPEAAQVQCGLHRGSRPAHRLAAIVSGQHCRQWRRPRELLRRPHHGGRYLGPVGLLFSKERRGRHRDCIARHRLRRGARLWRARNFDRDRADDRRDRRRTRPRSHRVPSAQRVEDRNEDHPGCDPARDATRRGGAGKVAGARAVGWPRGSQAGV